MPYRIGENYYKTPVKIRRPSPASQTDRAIPPDSVAVMLRGRPLLVTISTGDFAFPAWIRAAATATAPVPQASVSASTPRS